MLVEKVVVREVGARPANGAGGKMRTGCEEIGQRLVNVMPGGMAVIRNRNTTDLATLDLLVTDHVHATITVFARKTGIVEERRTPPRPAVVPTRSMNVAAERGERKGGGAKR